MHCDVTKYDRRSLARHNRRVKRKSAKRAATRGRARRAVAQDLRLRRLPQQSRGQETFDLILATTGRLLQERGADGITTNLIATSAGVNVATLYQYFPNKRAILVQLFQRQAEHRRQSIEGAFQGALAKNGDWRSAIVAAIDAVHAIRRNVPGSLALGQAMRADPGLLQYDRTESRDLAQWLSAELKRNSTLSQPDADLVARCSIEGVRALLDLSQLDASFDERETLQQAREIAIRYLEPYFSRARSVRSRARSST